MPDELEIGNQVKALLKIIDAGNEWLVTYCSLSDILFDAIYILLLGNRLFFLKLEKLVNNLGIRVWEKLGF